MLLSFFILLSLFVIRSSSQKEPDRSVLLSFGYFDSGIPNLCGQSGVACNLDGYVTYLEISGLPAKSTIPTQLGQLSKITYLGLQSNSLEGTIPTELGNLKTLKTLSLSFNLLTGTIPVELSNLVALTDLLLLDNKLISSIPVELTKLVSLTNLFLENNRLNGTIPSFSNVQTVRIGGNRLTGSIPSTFFGTKLRNFNAYGNLLTGSIPTEVSLSTNLLILNVNGNQLTGNVPIITSTSFFQLYLDNNKLNGTIPTEIGLLKELNILQLNRNQLSGSIPTEIAKLAKLTTLTLSSNFFNCPNTFTLGNDISTLNSQCAVSCPLNSCPFNLCSISGANYNIGKCVDTNECLTNNGGCSSNAKCTNTIGSRTCTCLPGFSGNGITCNDIDECLINNGNCAYGNCVNTIGSRNCSCFQGFLYNGKSCQCPSYTVRRGITCVSRKTAFYSQFTPILRFSFDGHTSDDVVPTTLANIGSAKLVSIYQRNYPVNEAVRMLVSDLITLPPVTIPAKFTFEVLLHTVSYPSFPSLSDILIVLPEGKTQRSEATLIVSIDSIGRIVRESQGVILDISSRVVRLGVSQSLALSFSSGTIITQFDGVILSQIRNFNNHIPDVSYDVQSGNNFDGYIDEIGIFSKAVGLNFLHSLYFCKNPCPTGQVCINTLIGESCTPRIF